MAHFSAIQRSEFNIKSSLELNFTQEFLYTNHSFFFASPQHDTHFSAIIEPEYRKSGATNMYAMVMQKQSEKLTYTTLEKPVPRQHEILIKVSACGICRTDLHIVDGELKLINIKRTK